MADISLALNPRFPSAEHDAIRFGDSSFHQTCFKDLKMNDRLSKLNILVVTYKYDLREDNDLIELTKDESVLQTWSTIPGLGVKFA